jgi:cell division protein FtsI/penicillin-binding protein 2
MSKGFASNYRIVVLASLVLLCFAGLGARLFCLHVIDRQVLLDTVEKARRQIIIQYARRGDILDRNGNLLATSRSLIVLGVDPRLLRKEDENKWPQLAELAGLPLAALQTILNTRFRPAGDDLPPGGAAAGSKPYDFIIGKAVEDGKAGDESEDDDTQLGEPEAGGERPIKWAKLCDTISESTFAGIVKLGIRGITGDRVYRRVYPHNELAAHVIGYVNRAEQPVTGIESYADFYLHGQNGWVESEKDGRRVELAQFRTREVPPADGYSVVLSIDAVIQHMAEQELDNIVEKFRPLKATIIISDPRTGFILALANTPTFDLNGYNKLPKAEQNRLRNIAVADMYEPGSVFKIVAASGALNDGLVTPETTFDCSLESVVINGAVRGLPGEFEGEHFDLLSVSDILARSSNKGAAQMGILLGARRFYDYVRAFGFGQLTGFPAGAEIRGLVNPPEKWDGLTITRMPMGQSVDVTPLQMHQAMCVIANGGLLMRPQIIKEIRDPSGEAAYRLGPATVRRVISEQTAKTMTHVLERVLTDPEGTAYAEWKGATPGYDVAGKTGTAQKYGAVTLANGRIAERVLPHQNVASFIGFFPAENPQVAISVVVDDAEEALVGGTASGAKVAVPSFKHLAEQIIPYKAIQSDADHLVRPSMAMEGGLR